MLTVSRRWVDWCIPQPAPSWIAIAWRADDDWLHAGARTALDRILNSGHTETYERAPMDWRSWNAYAAVLDDPHLSAAALRGESRGIGHTTPTSAALVQTDGTILADSRNLPSLQVLRHWLQIPDLEFSELNCPRRGAAGSLVTNRAMCGSKRSAAQATGSSSPTNCARTAM